MSALTQRQSAGGTHPRRRRSHRRHRHGASARAGTRADHRRHRHRRVVPAGIRGARTGFAHPAVGRPAAAAVLGRAGLLVPDVPAQHPADPRSGRRPRRGHRVLRGPGVVVAGGRSADVRHGAGAGRDRGAARRRHRRGRGPQTRPAQEGDGDPDGREPHQRRGGADVVLRRGGPGRGHPHLHREPVPVVRLQRDRRAVGRVRRSGT